MVVGKWRQLHSKINKKYISKIKKETKHTLMKQQNNLQESNSRVDKAENLINDLNIRKHKTTNQNKKKRESKKQG